jgi:uncharacterized protein (DUF1800 family)
LKLEKSKNTIVKEAWPLPRGILTGLDEYTGPWTATQAAHLIRRTMFGAKKAEIKSISAMKMTDAVDLLLQTPPTPAQPVNDYNDVNTDKLADKVVPFGQPWANLATRDIEIEFWKNVSLKCWWFNNIIEQKYSIQEKMLLFWQNHIPIQFFEVYDARHSYRYLSMLRQHSLGNFKSMVKAVTIDPAMLFYLNGHDNVKAAPDENYARELQELFCIGKGPDSKYTEEDVQAAARVLTGWKSDYNKPNVTFNTNDHDYGDKVFSAFYGNKIIKGIQGTNGGSTELDQMLDMIFANPECAKHIVRKLYRFFVYHTIDAATETNVIVPLAQLFQSSGFDIKKVMSKLLKSEHFYDVLNRGAIIKTPLDFTLGMLREYDMLKPDKTNLKEMFWVRANMYWWIRDMLLDIGDPPNVAGWPAWYQTPQFDKYWISTTTLPKRGSLSDMMIYWGYENKDKSIRYGIDEFAFTKTLTKPEDPNLLIEEVLSLFLSINVSTAAKQNLKSILLDKQDQDYYWTNAWLDHIKNPNDAMKKDNVKWKLKAFYQYVMQMEEYQLM